MEWYCYLGIISWGIFIIQLIISGLGIADTDLDVDFDGNIDFDVGDLVSFKGFLHFLLGFSSWLMLTNYISALNIIIACIVGIVFVLLLYFIYKLCLKFDYEPKVESKQDLIGKLVTVYLPYPNGYCVCKLNTPVYTEIGCKADCEVKAGDVLVIKEYKNGIYCISKTN